MQALLFGAQPKKGALQSHWRPASAVFARPSHASAIPATPTPNFFSAPRRVTDWARPLASSSNLSFITFLSFSFVGLWFEGRNLYARRDPGCIHAERVTQRRAIKRIDSRVVVVEAGQS